MNFSGIQKTTLIDYPGKVATTLFTHGCNFRCPFCHNPELVIEKEDGVISEEEVIKFLKSRIGKLDGVVITGGEPLLQANLKIFLGKVKGLGFLIKVDTNGSVPQEIENLYDIVDYWAMDIKNSPEKYLETIGVPVKIEGIKKSIKILMSGGSEYEFRTTVVPGLHDMNSMIGISKLIKGGKKYTIQNFRNGKTIDKDYSQKDSFSFNQLNEFKRIVKDYVGEVTVLEN